MTKKKDETTQEQRAWDLSPAPPASVSEIQTGLGEIIPGPPPEPPRPRGPQVYAAIAKVTALLAKGGVAKTRQNVQQGYAFRGIDEVLNALNPALVDAGLVITPTFRDRHVIERQTANNKPLFSVSLVGSFTLTSTLDGTSTHVMTQGEAMDTADKATNKAMSAAYKYMALLTFCIPLVGEDADETTHEPAGRMVQAPAGYESWIESLQAAAVAGTLKLREAYKAGTEPMRAHMLATDKTLTDKLKALAGEADNAMPKAMP